MSETTYRLHVYGKGWVTGYGGNEDKNEYDIVFGSLKDALPFGYSWGDIKMKRYLQDNYEGVTTELILNGSELLR